MSGFLRAVAPGPYVTVQDGGRLGWRRFGVASAGAMDQLAFTMANALVGNSVNAAAVEFGHVGGTWEVCAESCRIAVSGGQFRMTIDDVPVAAWRSHTLRRGQRLTIKAAPDAVWGYLAVTQGFDVPLRLGSVATHLRSSLGGFDGRLIVAGDALSLRCSRAPDGPERWITPVRRPAAVLRVVLGPQRHAFTKEAIDTFIAGEYCVTHRADRTAMWLDGPTLTHVGDHNIISDGVMPGCIQVPGDGQALVLLMDCQTIGGYPKLGAIISTDLPRLVQCHPGTLVTFIVVDIETAQRRYCEYNAMLRSLRHMTSFLA